ncbi:LacI family transcriptional regulator [Neolewinella xylanilytica]|uniref:LacI family transcriptional regulator n=1 Tax=Neolewinella xylanilytica TaxID=1514080 RepID=A0A2S6I482_9BACT|nr:LacI family DNA-binding transcriptional regulator [Neolewinella xylanilytica]PPK85871.1 LacI family transcriptional regulator [Neolewinella xylanilytica]
MNKNRKKRVTIYDLAMELNVAPSTVSRALQDHFSIGRETRDAVKELARKRGYRTNVVAANLRMQTSNTIGVLVPWINRPFISSLISGVEEAAQEFGYNVIISQSQDCYDREVANVKTLVDSRIHALLVSLAMETTHYDHIEEIIRGGTPVVFVDRVPSSLPGHRVIIDNYQAAFEATQHLIDQGCKRIAIFSGAQHQQIYRERQLGYLAALDQNGLDIDQDLICSLDRLTLDEGYRLTEKLFLLDSRPDGIFSTNDGAAVGAIKFARQNNIPIPEELALIGFNNDPICEIVEPQLSSMTHPAAQMGRQALLQALKVATPEATTENLLVQLTTEVIIRASSRKTQATTSPE